MPSPVPAAAPSPAQEPRLARVGPAAFAALTFAAHAACGGRYGIFRDELYFIVCGQRLATGYVDQPPGIALVAGAAHALFGTWVPGLRLLPWLAAAATVYVAGRLAARLGAGGPGATLAAAGTFACLVLRGTGHLLTMNAFDPLLVAGLAFVLVRLADGEDRRLWVAAGALAGLATLFKYTSAVVALLFLAGLLLSPGRRALRSRWALAGAAAGLLAVLPNLAWQAAHGFPFLELARNGLLYKNAPLSPGRLVGQVLFEANPGNAPLWVGGALWLALAPAGARGRFAGVGGLAYLALLAFGHGKPYYFAPVLPVLLAGGGAAAAHLGRRAPRLLVDRAGALHGYGAALTASALVLLPMALPILPEEAFVRYQAALGMRPRSLERPKQGALPQVYADMHGFDAIAAAAGRVYARLPPEQQRTAAVYGANYGLASAVNVLGPEHGMPPGLGVSGHNSYWLWGLPPGRGDPLIVVGDAREDCGHLFAHREEAEILPHDPLVMPYEDEHVISVCRGLLQPLDRLPAAVRHFE